MNVIGRTEREGSTAHDIDGNRLILLPGGEDRLVALLDLIEGAHHRLDLCFYIFLNDSTGRAVVDALIDAGNRGVSVTLLIDAFGSAFTPDTLFRPLVEAGARVGRFGKRRSTRYLIRNHQKMAIADGRRALVGGFNVENSYFQPESEHLAWRDLGLRVEGPLAQDLCRWFDGLAAWTLSERQSFRALRHMVRDWKPGNGNATWLIGGPTRLLNRWAHGAKHDLELGERLDMVEAYFSPGGGMVRRMSIIAQRGTARLVVPMYSDNRATIGAARHLYKRLLRSGLQIFEYQAQKLHTKLLVVDDITYIGSANFDMRSLFVNVELMLRIDDAAFAESARAEVQAHVDQSRFIDPLTYRHMAGPISRLRWWFNYLLVGVLDYTVTRRLNARRRRPR